MAFLTRTRQRKSASASCALCSHREAFLPPPPPHRPSPMYVPGQYASSSGGMPEELAMQTNGGFSWDGIYCRRMRFVNS